MKKRPRKTITLAEAGIVLVILSILSSIVIPELTQANVDFRERELQAGLQQLRDQANLYRKEHDGRLLETGKLVAQLTMRSNKAGRVIPHNGNAKDYSLGPYLKRIPKNPYVNKRVADRVEVGAGTGGDQCAGWYFNEKTGEIWPDHEVNLSWIRKNTPTIKN